MTSYQKDASVLPFAQSSAPPDVVRAMRQQLVQEVITSPCVQMASRFAWQLGQT